jgi:hypothetical protein
MTTGLRPTAGIEMTTELDPPTEVFNTVDVCRVEKNSNLCVLFEYFYHPDGHLWMATVRGLQKEIRRLS